MTSLHELLQQMENADVLNNKFCVLKHLPPSQAPSPPACPLDFFSPKGDANQSVVVINTCNVTGQWAEFDRDVQSNCAMFTGLVFRVREKNEPWRMFANLFCAICNGVRLGNVGVCPFDHTTEPPLTVAPLTFLLGTQERGDWDHDTMKECPPGQWMSVDVGAVKQDSEKQSRF